MPPWSVSLVPAASRTSNISGHWASKVAVMTLTQRRAVLKDGTTFPPPPPLCVSNLTVNGVVLCLFVIISDMTTEETWSLIMNYADWSITLTQQQDYICGFYVQMVTLFKFGLHCVFNSCFQSIWRRSLGATEAGGEASGLQGICYGPRAAGLVRHLVAITIAYTHFIRCWIFYSHL